MSDDSERIKELEAQILAAEKEADDAKKFNAILAKKIEDVKKQTEYEKKRAADAKKLYAILAKKSEDAKKQIEYEKKRADDATNKIRPTVFFELLQNTHTLFPPRFTVETDPSRLAGGPAAIVQGKWYPRCLKLWEDFPQLHRSTFDRLTTVFGDSQLFDSLHSTESVANIISPSKRRTEEDVRALISMYLELPSAQIVNKYLEKTTAAHRFRFNNSHTGLAQWKSPSSRLTFPASQTSNTSSSSASSKQKFQEPGILSPDRWGLRTTKTTKNKQRHCLVGEYKAAHKLLGVFYRNVLGTPGALPAESLIGDCVARSLSDQGTETAQEASDNADASATHNRQSDKEEMYVSQTLCQAYHYMVVYGIQYGYISSSVGSVFLKVSPATPHTLFYHFVDHTVPALPINNPGDDLVHTPPAQLVTLILEALAVENAGSGHAFSTDTSFPIWPEPRSKSHKGTTLFALRGRLPHNNDGDNDGGDSGAGSGTAGHSGQGSSILTYPGADSSTGGSNTGGSNTGGNNTGGSSSTQNRSRMPPRDEYCTHKCLLGLTRGGVLDPRCPNAPEHVRTGGGKGTRLGPDGQQQQCHAITAAELCTMLVAQQTQHYHNGVKNLVHQGLRGAVGTLFKITLLEHGYTFVGKGVGDGKRRCIDHEASIYTHSKIQPLQGDMIPVYLGTVELEEYPFFVIGDFPLWHLMLMSWVGDSLVKYRPLLPGFDCDEVKYSMELFAYKLAARGLGHGDLRLSNFAWSAERGHLMAIDFDRSKVLDDQDMAELAMYLSSPEQSPESSPRPVKIQGDPEDEDAASATEGSAPVKMLKPESICTMAVATPELLDTSLAEKRDAHDAGLCDESIGGIGDRDTKRSRTDESSCVQLKTLE